MADYDKTFIISPELRDEMIKELERGNIQIVVICLQTLNPCYPTGRN